MSLMTHLSELERKHQALDEKLHDELARPAKNDREIAALKRKKLLIKDEITRIRATRITPGATMH